ncbi:MAG: HPr family phosphocarrier protein [Pyrinomonadaceae bacterium]|nr:HPr family phosphocarrier protein [Pyrinomonadaceae bacterium]
MLEREIRIINPLGLHARAAAKVVRCSVRFESRVELRRGEASADAKSILSILALAAGFGTVVTVIVDGSDEEDVMNELSVLFLSGFGEI